MFEYIKQLYTVIIDKLKFTNVVYISGETRIGKTYLVKNCMSRYSDSEYFKLYLKAYHNYNPSYSPFLLGLMKLDAFFETNREALLNILTSSENSKIKLLGEIIEYGRSFREKRFSQLNAMELSIINRINYYCNNRPLFLIIDDFEKWDKDSKELLNFFMTKEARENIPFLKSSKIIIISEDINTLYSLKEFASDLFSINIPNLNDEEVFIKELVLKNGKSNEHLYKMLFNISNGNPGIACDILQYIDNNSNEDISYIWNKPEYKTLITNVLDKRTYELNKKQPDFIQTIKAASVIGEIFNQLYLPDIIEENEFAINKILATAQKQQFIDIYENQNYIYNFFNKIIYQYFDENFNENKKEYHYKFAIAIKKFKPDDYYMQFHHLRASGKVFESLEVLTIYLVRQEFMGHLIDEELKKYLKENSSALFENYELFRNAIKEYHKDSLYNALNQLEYINPVSEVVLHERDYLKAFIIYDLGNKNDFDEAHDILLENFNILHNNSFDIWLRSSVLLYIFYVNRLCDFHQARLIEKRIVKEVASRYKYNPDLENTVQILNRNAGAIYSTEIALQKTLKSIKYFENNLSKEPVQYLMALTNYSGLLMVASDYQEGFRISKISIDLLHEHKIWIKDFYKIINNYVINGFLSDEINCIEALEIYEQLFTDTFLKDKVLLRNNYFYFKLCNGDTQGLLDEIYKLFKSDAVQKHNDYYIYLIGINTICIALINNNIQVAKLVFEKLNKIIPSICSREEYYIIQRYSVFEDIIYGKTNILKNVEDLENIFYDKLSVFSYDYPKRPYILTDQQFWSIF